MITLQKGNYNISWTGNKFDEVFGKDKVSTEKIELKFRTLERAMPDEEILAEFRPEKITLSELAYVLENKLLDENKHKADFIICVDEDMTNTY